MTPFKPRTMAEIEEEVARLKVEWPVGLRDQFSASQATMLARCPEQYRQRYVLGIKEAPNPNLIFGSADTHTIGEHFRRQMDTGEGMGVLEIGDYFAAEYEKLVEEAGGVMEVKWRSDRVLPRAAAVKMRDEQRRVGAALASLYRREVADTVRPVAVEEEIIVTDPLWPVEIIGYMDVTEEERVIERKTSTRSVNEPKTDWIYQARIYQLATHKPLDWHVSVKKKDPVILDGGALHLPYVPEQADKTRMLVLRAMRTIANHWRDYGPDDPWPDALTHPWACGYCGYRDTCPWQM